MRYVSGLKNHALIAKQRQNSAGNAPRCSSISGVTGEFWRQKIKASGGCLCGQLRYEIDGEPILMGNCYCADCQKETGSGHLTIVGLPASAVTLSGESRTFTKPGDSGGAVNRIFCPECGGTIYGQSAAMGNIRAIRAGTLDDSSEVTVQTAVYCSRAKDWDPVPAHVHGFAEMPPPESMP